MEINWVTVIAQIANFLLLVYLLKRFLYRPIIDAMDARERAIAARLEEASEREQQAAASEKQYRSLHEELAQQASALKESAQQEANEEKQQLLDQLREEINQQRVQWGQELENDQLEFIRRLKKESAATIARILRKILKDLAHTDLEQQIITVFLGRLDRFGRKKLDALCSNESPLVVATSFELDEAGRERLRGALQTRLAQHEIQFSHDPELVCGIELRSNHRKLAWNVPEYLDVLEQKLASLFADRQQPGETETAEHGT